MVSNTGDTPPALTALPLDVLNCIVPYLDAPSFLALCRTCKAFYDPTFRLDAAYWKSATKLTFRVADRLIAQSDGGLWQKLYRRLLHNTRVFTWGNNDRGSLGQEDPNDNDAQPPPRGPPRGMLRGRGPIMRRGPPPIIRRVTSSPYPGEMFKSKELGIVADLQCGGWSTTILTSKGILYSVGTLDGQSLGGHSKRVLTPLVFPPGFPQPVDRYDPSTAIKQFSSGRSHILGLSDSGKIWSWHSMDEPAWSITFAEREISEEATSQSSHSHLHRQQTVSSKTGSVRKVVAGWSVSSAYINGAGIVLWATANHNHYGSEAGKDTLVIQHSVPVPQTSYIRPTRSARDSDESTRELGQTVGEVVNYIVLDHFVVFVTDLGKFFAAKMSWDTRALTGHVEDIIELVDLRADLKTAGKFGGSFDIQGSFRSFAAFRNSGEVITSTQDYLEACWDRRLSSHDPENPVVPGLKRIPALQNSGVISVAFGDYHYHALHLNGTITSYGTESQACGSLGLGGRGEAESRLRGLRHSGRDRSLVQHAYTKGRKVWFEHEKREWIKFLSSGGTDPQEAQERMRMTTRDTDALGEVSEWIEQQGSDWDKEPEISAVDEDGLGTHFALSVAAYGWHSGALVLVNDELSQKLQESCISKEGFDKSPPGAAPGAFSEPWNHGAAREEGVWYKWAGDHFPRLKLSNGQDMPGADEVPFAEWKYGRPEFVLDQNF